MTVAPTRAVFLDRDGTLNVEKGYIRVVDDLELLPGAAQAIKALNQAGILAILTTNQTGAARGFYGIDHIHALHHRLEALLWEQAQAKLDAIFYCPHLAKGSVAEYAIECRCRKPQPGMIEDAVLQFPTLDLAKCFVIGDKASDVAFGHGVGATPYLVTTGYGDRVVAGKYQTLGQPPSAVFPSVVEAVQHIVSQPA
jgi:D-glycero-D-manno-heptose 1,7-bisphosphate phosphatase